MEKKTANCARSLACGTGSKADSGPAGRFMWKTFFYRIVSLAVALLLFLPFAFSQTGIISGIVKGSEGPLQAVTVTAGNTTVLTDEKGMFSLQLNPGSYTLLITHAGYKIKTQYLKVTNTPLDALEINLVPAVSLDEVTVFGSRSLVQRSNLNTTVPIDIFPARQLVQTAQASLTQMLNYSVPSFNASRPHNNEPATLRGLNPDHLLILVNGTRRHNMGIITSSGARGQLGGGGAPNDLNAIPFAAIEKIEILRDGAAAQYGSDAIAGVINIRLKKSTGTTSIHLQTGQYYMGDGSNLLIGINRGFTINKKGFLNFSADFRFNDYTYRGGTYTGTVYTANKRVDDSLVMARGFDRNKVSNAGSPKITRIGALLNGGYPIGKKSELFWTAALSIRQSRAYQSYTFPKNAYRVNPELFPNGFLSINRHQPIDLSGIAGVKGETRKGWHWEMTTAYGNNKDKYHQDNTNNASQFFTLGKAAPTSFYVGTLTYGQLTNNLQFSKNLSSNAEKLSSIAIGAEWRMEHYQIKPGEESSWKNYDSLGRKQPGVGGWSPDSEVAKKRNVGAAYIDFETDISRRLLIGIAARYENYSDFGGNLAGKLAVRYKPSEKIAIRGAVNNGFRAPSLPQRYYSVVQRSLVPRGSAVVPSTTGHFRNESPVASAFGIPNLTAEHSLNVSSGITVALDRAIRLTVDAYWIQIRNRIVISGRFDTTNPQVRNILQPFPDITQAQIFVNAVNTRTKGLDIVLNGSWQMKNGSLQTMLGANFTKTRVFGTIKPAGKLTPDSINLNTLFNREEKARLEYGQPASKIIFSLTYLTKRIEVLVRNTRFGATQTRFSNPMLNPDQNFSPKVLTDFSLSMHPRSWLTLTAGANNIFDVYPSRILDARNTQEGVNIYSLEASPFGFYGGYYFASLALKW